jgi:glycine hydroxymethyltransferase
MQPEFKVYAKQVVTNAKILADELMSKGYNLVTGGTETHLMLINLGNKNITGKQAESALGKAGITVNKNTVPHDPRKPFDPSGIRLGTPALTTRGMKEDEMKRVAGFIDRALNNIDNDTELSKIHSEVTEMCESFPLPNLDVSFF